MSIRQLLSAFNGNIQKNVALIDYLTCPSIFNTIGKARNEMLHSKMVEMILTSFHKPNDPESPFVHLLDILIKRACQQEKDVIPEELTNAVLCRSLPALSLISSDTEIVLSKYRKGSNQNDRIDIYLEFALANPLKKGGRTSIKVFIENKVQTHEHDGQTLTYYDSCKNKGGESCYTLFVYLTPLSSRELNDYTSLALEEKPECGAYISINYQDILDGIIEPILANGTIDQRNIVLLRDYVNCLELPALSDSVKQKDMSIMATSTYERDLTYKFLQERSNRELIELVVNYKTKGNLYNVNYKGCMDFDSALELALYHLINEAKDIYSNHKHDGELELISKFREVILSKNNGTPFIVYSPDGKQYVDTSLYEYKDSIFSTCKQAVEYAVVDFQNQKNIDSDEVISCFSKVCGNQNNGYPLLAKVVGDKYYLITDQIGMRRDVNDSMLDNINTVLDSPVTTITEDSFHELLVTGKCFDFLKDFNRDLYRRVQNTNYYFRQGIESKYEQINECLDYLLDKITLDPSDQVLLDSFYKSHKSLILSVLKISNENERDTSLYKKRDKALKILMRL